MALRALHPGRSVRARFFFLHVSILAPFVVLGFVWITNASMGERTRIIGQLEGKANRVVSATSTIAQEETTVLQTMAELPSIGQEKTIEMGPTLLAMLSHHPLVNNFHAADANGVIAVSAIQPGKEERMIDNQLFQEVMRTGRPSVGSARIAQEGRVAGQPVIPIAVPLRDRGGQQTGVLVAEIILSEIQRLVGLAPDPDGGYVYMVDRLGQVIAHPNMEYARTLRDFSDVPVVRDFLAGQEDTEEFYDSIEKARLIAVYRKAPMAGWGVVSVYPSALVSTTMARTGFGILVIFGISFVFAVTAAYVVGNGLADRIADLASAARAVNAGEGGRRIELVSHDEIGGLAHSLNAIFKRLGDQTANIETTSQELKRSCEDIGTALLASSEAGETIRLAMQASARLAHAKAAIGLLAQDEENLQVIQSMGPIPAPLIGQLLPLDGRPSILGRAVRQREPQQVRDLQEVGAPPDPLVILGRQAGLRSALVIPALSYGRCLWALVLFDVEPPRLLSHEVVTIVQKIANEAAAAIETSRLQERIRGANEQLMLSGLRLRTIVETIPEGVVVAEAPNGHITMTNSRAEELFGQRIVAEPDLHEQASAYHLYHIQGRLFKDEELPLYRSVVLGEMDTKEMVIRRPDGKSITVLFSSAPLQDRAGEVVGAVGVVRDITEMKELDQLKNEFISITSHELKSPMTVIKGYAQLLLRKVQGVPGRDEEAKWLTAITDQSTRLSLLVDRLLDVSRIQTGRLDLRRSPMDLVTLVRDVAEHEQVTTTLHRIRVHAEVPELVGNWDKARLEQVLINLVDNAIKYSPKGGPIDVTVCRIADEAEVSVQDRGMGIPKEEQKRIFERFYRAQMGKERPSGLGLGLYISYQIVTLHGGRMWVESEVGQGSTFCFTLPLSHLTRAEDG